MEEINKELKPTDKTKILNVVIVGCIHGNLKKMNEDIELYSKKNKISIDLVLCTGDFKTIRNESDLNYFIYKDRNKEKGDFYLYYNKILTAPYLTIFIGGNHESSNLLEQNFYGGFLCKNIFYLGNAGIINYNGIRIGGISGIFKNSRGDYFKGHWESNLNDIKDTNDFKKNNLSIYHTREFEYCKFSYVNGILDFFMSHDWPTNVVNENDFEKLINSHPENKFLRKDLYNHCLGSFPNEFILKYLKIKNYICGHMHIFYENKINDTNIYCLDQCKENSNYFKIVKIEKNIEKIDNKIYIDKEWISITKTFNEYFPNKEEYEYDIDELFCENSKLLYNNIVVKKVGKNKNFSQVKKIENIVEKIKNNLDEKKETIIKSDKLEEQYGNILEIFGIEENDNKHILSRKLNDKNNQDFDDEKKNKKLLLGKKTKSSF